MSAAIDVDRGIVFKQVVKFDAKNKNKFEPDEQYGGLAVYMYIDTPGVYYNVHGKEVPAAMAQKAGYDVTHLGKLRGKQLALAEFDRKLRAELEIELAEDEVVLAEAGEWKIIGLPADRAKVVDKETGEPVTAVPMSRSDAKKLLAELVAVNAQVDDVKDQANGSKKA